MEMGNEKNFRGHGYDTQLKNVLELAQASFHKKNYSRGVQHANGGSGAGDARGIMLQLHRMGVKNKLGASSRQPRHGRA